MILLAAPNIELHIPQSAMSIADPDPRTSEVSLFLDRLHDYTSESLRHLRNSQRTALNLDFAGLERQLDSLASLNAGWDGYDADAPSASVINEARKVLRSLQNELARPDKVGPSAEGGVAITFRSSGGRRVQIEILNNGERFAHLYDLQGNSNTHEWLEEEIDDNFEGLLGPVRAYLEQ